MLVLLNRIDRSAMEVTRWEDASKGGSESGVAGASGWPSSALLDNHMRWSLRLELQFMVAASLSRLEMLAFKFQRFMVLHSAERVPSRPLLDCVQAQRCLLAPSFCSTLIGSTCTSYNDPASPHANSSSSHSRT